MRLLDRYLLTEILPPFAFGLALFSGLFLGVEVLYDVVKMASRFHLSPGEILQFLGYQMVWILGYVLPMATLLAVLLAFGRLHHDGEVIALRAAGISFLRLLLPAAAWGLFVSLAGVGLNGRLVPNARAAAEEFAHRVRSGGSRPRSTENLMALLQQGIEDWLLLAKRFEEASGRMEQVIIVRLQGGHLRGFLEAQEALWQGERWVFRQGRLWDTTGRYPILVGEEREGSELLRLRVLPAELARLARSPESLGLGELRRLLRTYRGQSASPSQIAPLLYEYHAKWAIPFASLGLSLLAASLALCSQRTTTSIGLGLSVIVILLYELVWNILRFLGREGIFSPVLSAWLPDGFLFLVAGIWVWKRNR